LKSALIIVVIRCQILRLKCIKFDFGWGSAPDPAGGAYSAHPQPLARFKGPTSKGKQGSDGSGKGEESEGREGNGDLLQSLRRIDAPGLDCIMYV